MYIKHPNAAACGHCGYKGFITILTSYSERDLETVKSPCGYLVREISQPWGVAYELLRCSSCNELTLRRVDWHDDYGPEDYTYTILYPVDESKKSNRVKP